MVRNPEKNEQFVREHWENVGIKHYHIDGICYWMVHQHSHGIPLHGYESPELAWAAAAEFTQQRLEEIRKVEDSLDWMDWVISYGTCLPGGEVVVALLNEKLESLNKWMRP